MIKQIQKINQGNQNNWWQNNDLEQRLIFCYVFKF